MSALDDGLDSITTWGSSWHKNEIQYAARAELAQLRADLAAAQRERDDLRAALALGQINCDAAYDDLRQERDEARAQLREIDELIDPLDGQTLLEAVSYLIHDDGEPLTPRRCVTCAQEAAREMREKCIKVVDNSDIDDTLIWCAWDAVFRHDVELIESIRALPLPSCDGCNPLKPESENEATR